MSETTVAMVLLVGAGLLLNGFLRLRVVDPGPDPHRTHPPGVPVESGAGRGRGGSRMRSFCRLVERAGALLLLAAAGLAGVLWFTTRERTREIGVRMTLGANAGRIMLEMLHEGAGLALVGLVLGAGTAAVLARLMRSLLYEVGPHACRRTRWSRACWARRRRRRHFLPAWRASRQSPATALRAD